MLPIFTKLLSLLLCALKRPLFHTDMGVEAPQGNMGGHTMAVGPQVGCGWDTERQPPWPFCRQMQSIPSCLVLWVLPGPSSSTPTCNGPTSPQAPPRA